MSRPAVDIRPVQAGDIDALLADIRPRDLDEAEALIGPGQARQGLVDSVANSTLCWTGTVGGAVVWMFGVAPATLLGDVGVPWMVATRAADQERRALTRFTPAYIARMQALYPRLVNVVDARNTHSIAWLKRVGFTLLPAVPTGPARLPFHPFTLG